jgi:hypothetical protein
MGLPLLNLGLDSVEKLIVRKIRTVLKTDPLLTQPGVYVVAGQARSIQLWLGEGDENQDDDPGEEAVPCIRMAFGNYRSRRLTENQHVGQFELIFDVFTPGRHGDDVADLCNLLVQAMLPDDPTRHAYVRDLMMNQVTPGGSVSNYFFSMMGSVGVVRAQTRYATKTRVVMTINIDKDT